MSDFNAKKRREQKNEVFVPSDLDDPNDILRYIETPEPYLIRLKAAKAALKGEMPLPHQLCPHPVSKIIQFEDVVRETDRDGRPTNLFECQLCHATLFLVDGRGKSAADG